MNKDIENCSKDNCIDHASEERELKYCIKQPSSISMEVFNSSNTCDAFIKVEEEFIDIKTEDEIGEIQNEDWKVGIKFELPLEPVVEMDKAPKKFYKKNPLGESLEDFKAIRRIYRYSLLSRCTSCIYEFNQRLLKSKLSDRLNEKLIKCSQLILEPYRNDCIYIHTFQNLIKCLACNYTCQMKREILHHMSNHAKMTLRKCSVCLKEFEDINYFKKHLSTHKDESLANMFKCLACSFKGKRRRIFDQHLVDCKKERFFICFICKYKCRKKYMIQEHMLTHAKKKMICKDCNFISYYKDFKQEHRCKLHVVFNKINDPSSTIHSSKSQDIKRIHIKPEWSTKEKLEAFWCYRFASHKSFPKRGTNARLHEILLKRGIIKWYKIENVHVSILKNLACDVEFLKTEVTKKQIRRAMYEVDKYFFYPMRFPKEDTVKKKSKITGKETNRKEKAQNLKNPKPNMVVKKISKITGKETKGKKKVQNLKNPKSRMVVFHQEGYELMKESSESNQETSFNDFVLIKREPEERSSQPHHQILSDIPNDKDQIPLSELVSTFVTSPSEPQNPILVEPFLRVNPPGIRFRWSREENLESLWCYTFATHKSFPSKGRDLRLWEILLKRGIIDKNKLSITPITRFGILASRVRFGKTAITTEEIQKVETEVEDYLYYLKHSPTEDTVKMEREVITNDDMSVYVVEEPLTDDMGSNESFDDQLRIKTNEDENAVVVENSSPENVEFILGL